MRASAAARAVERLRRPGQGRPRLRFARLPFRAGARYLKGMSEESDGANLFGDQPGGGQGPGGYLVLARKYRPARFEDLIGQEAMVRTIANSFALNRIPHAYVLTGVRGVGKTTTARLLARALNYKTDVTDGPSIKLDPPGVHCQSIMESRHPDVFEMDAASRTGINDIRELLEGVRYAPVTARTKVYIIDEVHMLSTAAFNGLLKTLEEPPPHVKFVFATTEIRKVPVTVLSRCQRFDLKRIPPERLVAHLASICAKEKVSVTEEGLALIARAAEGSVRDALSLLDQALVQNSGAEVTAASVRDMLGLADRGRAADLFAAVLAADAKAALIEVRAQYDSGADPALIVRDLLEITHEVTRIQALGEAPLGLGAADYVMRLEAMAKQATAGQLARLWQMLLKAADETARAPDPIAAAEMALVRLCAAQKLPPPEEAARMLREAAAGPAQAPGAAPSGGEGPRLEKFEDVVALIDKKREANLAYDVERFVRLAEFAPGLIRYAPAEGAPPDLPMRLARALKDWTGETWTIRADGEQGVESLSERRKREEAARLDALKRQPFVAAALKAFPGAEVEGVRETHPQTPESAIVPFKRKEAK